MLDTYEQERLPIGTFTVDQAYARYINRSAPELRDYRVHEEVHDYAFELGQRYHQSQAVAYGANGGGKIWEDPTDPIASAGSRAPHFWTDHAQKKSIYDSLLRTEFTLLVPKSHHTSYWSEAGDALKAEFPITTVIVSNARFCTLYKITHSGCVLVRPDQYIAWKAVGVPHQSVKKENVCRDILRGVLRRLLFLDPSLPLAKPKTTLVNGVISAKAEEPATNGVREITGEKLLDYLRGTPKI